MKTKLRILIILLGTVQFVIAQTNFITKWQTVDINQDIVIPTSSSETYTYDVDWENDGVFDAIGITGDATHTYATPGIHTIAIRGDFPQLNMAGGYANTLLSVEQWGTIVWRSMERAFAYCANMVINATDKPNLANVTNMSQMFYQASSLNSNIGNWDVSNITDMSFMFSSASSFNQDISNWNVSNVTNMNSMFESASAFNQNIGKWDVSNVTDMANMFYYASAFNQNIGAWDVSKVNNMSYMFAFSSAFNQNIVPWNVSNVTNMNSMFYNAFAFNQDIGDWDVSKVALMPYMFYGASAFNQDIGNWDVSNIATASNGLIGMLNGTSLSTENYDALLIGWNALPSLANDVSFDAGMTTFCKGSEARTNMINTYNWRFEDGGKDPECTILSATAPQEESFILYPNPTRGVIYIKNASANSIHVYNTLGQEVYTANLNNNENTTKLDLKYLKSGSYILKLNNAEGVKTKHLILD